MHPLNHSRTLSQVVNAAKSLLPKRQEAERIVREIKRQEDREAAQSASKTIGETEPDE